MVCVYSVVTSVCFYSHKGKKIKDHTDPFNIDRAH